MAEPPLPILHGLEQRADTLPWLDQIIRQAVHQGASDIHFEWSAEAYRIRLRQDGILHPIAAPPKSEGLQIAARLKVLAQLDTTERRLPQDGSFSFPLAEKNQIDCRLSTCPSLFGEKMVLRLLHQPRNQYSLEDLGLSPRQYNQLKQALDRPEGMILVTGPTGSGKTSTLYAALQQLNQPEVNIVTIEDPVEIRVPGLNQVAIQPKLDFSFAKALRAIVRQDPDIIMVGEIRDLETANIAIQAAHSGHLVLSSLHTKSAVHTIERLLHMGIAAEPLASAISLIIAQRLVRKSCPLCQKLKGCSQCFQGYRGRMGVFEVLPLSPSLQQLILSGANALSLLAQAKQEGLVTLAESGRNLIKQGCLSLTEFHRVIDGSV